MREIRTLRARWRGLETKPRTTLLGHGGGNPRYGQGKSYGPSRQLSTLPDGCEFQAFTADEDQLIVLGLSVWDSDTDAREFAEGFAQVLADVHDPGMFAVAQDGSFVRFVIGQGEGERRRMSMESLAAAQALSLPGE